MVGDLLTASYNGGEAGTKVFTWAGTCEEGGTGIYCTPTKTGTYKATLNIDGYYPKASNGVVVFPQPIPFAGNVSIAVENDYPFVLVGDTLTASYDDTDATPTFTWSRSCEEGQNSAICTPTTTGTYAVTASAQGFISETEQISVVTPQPQTATVSIIATETPVYTRDTLTASYSEDDTGVTYTWHSANNIQQGSGKTFSTQFYGSFYVNAKKARYQDKKSATVTIVARPTLSANVSIAAEANPQFVIDGTVYTGATLKATYGGSEEVSYAWTRSYYPICSDSDTCITTQPGRYEVTISSGRYATKISNYITVTDDPLVWFKGPLSILSDYPADDTRVGDKLRANYLGDDSGGLSYAWYNTSGTKLSTNSIFTTTESGTMRLVVSKSGYHDIEKTYDVVEKPVLPKLTVTSANSYLVNGLLTASAYSGDETISYQWYHDNVAIDGATSSTYMPTAVGYYYVEISAPRTTTTASDPVGVKAVASQDPLLPGNVSFNETAFIGDTLKVTYVGDGSLTLTYKWYLNNVLIDGVTTATYKPAAGAVGTYRVEIGASGYASRTVELRVSGWVRAADYTTIFGEYGVQDIAYGNGVYVGIGSSDLGYSTDGITWQTTGESGAGNLAGIVFGDGVFVRIGWGAKYSTDGINWTQATGDDVLESVIGTHIAYGNNTFVAINGTNMVYSKDGGQTWTTNTSAFPPAASYKGIDYVNDRFLLVTNFGEIAYSTDGVTFTAATGTKQASALSGEGIFAYGNGRYILAYNDYIAYSDDPTAATWEPLKDIVGSSASKIHGITFGNGKFVLVSEALFGSDGNVAYSLDGLTWVDFPVGYSFEYNADIGYSILYDGSKFIAGGKNSGSTMSKIIYMVD
jgi:hypothetical protein